MRRRGCTDFDKWRHVAKVFRGVTGWVYRDGADDRAALNAVANACLGISIQRAAMVSTLVDFRFIAEVEPIIPVIAAPSR